jgi:multidrug efflux pump subunit AcrA (membrane-fusion protein)
MTQLIRMTMVIFTATLLGCSKPEAPVVQSPLVKTIVLTVSDGGPSSRGAVSVVPETSRALKAELAGTVMEILVKPGDPVLPGQALVRLDPRDAQLSDSAARVQAAAARAELATAEADFVRYTELRDKSFISEAEFGRRQAALAVARAQYEATLDRLGVNTLRANRRGRVAEVRVQVGQVVSGGMPLVSLQSVAEPVPIGPPVTAPSTRSARMMLPTTALLDGQRVMVVLAGDTPGTYRVVSRSIRLGAVDDRAATVVSGLTPGDRVVAVGAHLLVEGQAVRLLESPGS